MKSRRLLIIVLLPGVLFPLTSAFGVQGEGASGPLQVNADAAMEGSKLGLEVSAGGERSWIQSTHPTDERAFGVRFLLDPHTLDLTAGTRITILRLYSKKNRHHVKLVLRHIEAKRFSLSVFARGNRGRYTSVGSGVVRRNRETLIELIWYAASGRRKSDGGLVLLIDGRLIAAESVLGNGKLTVEGVRLGIMESGTPEAVGSYFLDEYGSFRVPNPFGLVPEAGHIDDL